MMSTREPLTAAEVIDAHHRTQERDDRVEAVQRGGAPGDFGHGSREPFTGAFTRRLNGGCVVRPD